MKTKPPRLTQKLASLVLPALSALLLLTTACRIRSNPEVRLGVPYHAQDPGSFDCGPASVQMWADYDFSTYPTQAQIGNWMGGTSCGVSQQVIADAVNHFTLTYDAYWDFVGSNEQGHFMSRQITSIDNNRPVIAIISFNHAGVVNGGRWHSITGGYQWDYVYFHDPDAWANVYYSSESWIDSNCPPGSPCEQIVSSSASGAWSSNYNNYSDSVYDSSGTPAIDYQDV